MTQADVGPGYRVRTDPDDRDPRLRGRRYAIPFDRVWQAAFRLVSGELRGWTLTWQDDRDGVLEARVPKQFLQPEGLVKVRVYLDDDAQTCVSMAAGPASGGRDLGASSRRIRRFFTALDQALEPRPGELLTPHPTRH